MSVERELTMPCLGRPFQLGMLYDCRNDQLIPDVTVWNLEKLKQAINSKPEQTSDFEIIPEDSIEIKMSKLGINAYLKLSLLAGLVNISGAATYLNDQICSKNQARISLKYQCKSRSDKLALERLDELDNSDAIEDKTATHVVTGVLYGADAILVFDQQVSDDENIQNIHEFMKTMIEKLPAISTSSDAALDISDDDKERIQKFHCTLHCDLSLPERPNTFEGAVKLCKTLPKLLSGKDFPKKVWLCPLSRLKGNVPQIGWEIHTDFTSQTQEMIEGLHKLEMQSNGLMKTNVCTFFPNILEKLFRFKRQIVEYKVDFTDNLAALLPQVRGGSKKEAELIEFFEGKHASPFNYQHLSSWVEGKIREVKILQTYLNGMKSIEFAFSPGDMDSIVNDLQYDYVVSFTFKVPPRHDPYLEEMTTYLHSHKTSQNIKNPPWYSNPKVMSDMKLLAKRFKGFAEANEGSETKFVVTSSSSNEQADKAAVIELYEDFNTEVFEPPSQPGKPSSTSVTHNSIQLKWSKPKYGSQNVELYIVLYRDVSRLPEQWKEMETDGTEESITVNRLDPLTEYSFKVHAKCKAGISTGSEISDLIQTEALSSPPGKPAASNVTYNSVQLKWSKPQCGGQNVKFYTISYSEINDSPPNLQAQWKRTNIETVTESATLNCLTAQTLYSFKVYAEFSSGVCTSSEVSNPIQTDPFPVSPSQPIASRVAHDSVHLQWSKVEFEAQNVEFYVIHYHEIKDPPDSEPQWIELKTDGAEECITVSDLTAQTSYFFKVCVKFKDGMSSFSEVSIPIQTKPKPVPPGKPTNSSITHKSIELQWSKPHYEEYNIKFYTIHYRETKHSPDLEEQWKIYEVKSEEESVTVSNLAAQTLYSFKVHVEFENGVNLISDISEPIQTYPSPEPPGRPIASNITHNSIQVEWSKPQYGEQDVEFYTVFYRESKDPPEQWEEKVTDGPICKESITVSNLQAKTKYFFRVYAKFEADIIVPSEISYPIQTYPCPVDPGKPTASNVTDDTIQLEWSKPQYKEQSVEAYTVFYCEVKDSPDLERWKEIKVNDTKECVKVSNLSVKTVYCFKVCAEFKDGITLVSAISDPIQTQPPPMRPGKPTASSVTHNSVKLEWSKSQYEGQNSELYRVFYHKMKDPLNLDLKQWKEVKTSNTSTTVSSLDAHTQYTFKVRAEFKTAKYLVSDNSDPIETNSFPIPPGKPTASNVTPSSIQLEWSKPQYGEQNIEHYTILHRMAKDPVQHWRIISPIYKQSVTVSSLASQSVYFFEVYAKFKSGTILVSAISDPIQTTAIPAVPPGKPTARNVSHSSIQLEWSRAYHEGQNAECYIVCYRKFRDPPDPEPWKEFETFSVTATVSDLVPKTAYSFEVHAKFKNDIIVISDISDPIQTDCPPPPVPPRTLIASSVTHNSVHLEWSKPHCKEQKLYYTVFYCESEGQLENWKVWETNSPITEEFTTVSGLAPQTKYYFKYHSVFSTKTLDSKISDAIQTYPPPVPPGKPTALDVTCNSILLEWSEAQYKTQNVEFYTVMIETALQQGWKEIGYIYKATVSLSCLAPETEYFFKICAKFEGEITLVSETSDSIQTHPLPIFPGKPFPSSVTHNSIHLEWSKPQYKAQAVESYTVCYSEINDPPDLEQWKEITINSSEESVIVDNLAAQTTYCFKVYAKFNAGITMVSDISNPIQTNRLLVSPGQPVSTNVTHSSVNLEWSTAHYGTQNAEQYTILYCEVKDLPQWKEALKSDYTFGRVDGLVAQTEYTFKVQAEFKTGVSLVGNRSDPILTYPTPVPPGKPTVSNVTHNSVDLEWSKPQYAGKQDVQFYTIWIKERQQWRVLRKGHVKESASIPNLTSQTEYSFIVRATFKADITLESDSSDPVLTDRYIVRPSKPTSHVVTHKSIQLRWSKARYGQQDAEYYNLFYKLKLSTQWKKYKSFQQTSGTVSNLVAHTQYFFKVEAKFKHYGYSLMSYPSDPIQTYPPPVSPGKPLASSVTHSSVHLKWSKPEYGKESVDYYTVCFRKIKNPLEEWEAFTPDDTCKESVLVCGLDPHSDYSFKVRANFKYCYLESVISDSICTKPAPVIPGKPYPYSVTHNSIQLQWSKPQFGAQNIEYYAVLYCEAKDSPYQWREKRTKGAKESFVVSGLVAKTEYCFKIRAEMKETFGLVSDISDVSDTIVTSDRRIALQMLSEKPTREGTLHIHKLAMVDEITDESKQLKKCYVGTKHPPSLSIKEKVLMVVGATGAGKSTLINGMINYILDVEWKDVFRFKLIVDEATHSQSVSQTKWITAYTLPKMEGSPVPYTLTIIDTPGFGDTEGLKRDKFITSQIRDFFSKKPPHGIDHIDGIGFVTQSSVARLTPTQRYIFDSILSIFGKDVASNIFMMVTFADGAHPPVLTAIEDAKLPYSHFYKFNNSALFADNTIADTDEDDIENFDQMFWKMGFISFRDFFTDFHKTEPKSLQLTIEVLKERERLETIVSSLQPQIRSGLAKIEEMRQEEEVLRQHEADIATNKDFIYEVDITKQDKVSIKGLGIHVTNCLRCNYTCHEDCKIPNDEEKYRCSAMGANKHCRVCTGKCSWDQHVNNPYKFVERVEKETRTSEDLKKKYDQAVSGRTQQENMMAGIDCELKAMHTNVLTNIKRVQQCLHRLDEIALKPNPLTEVDFLDLLIESEKQQSRPGWLHRVHYYEAAKEQAVLLKKIQVKDVVKDIETNTNSDQKNKSLSWYNRFMYWIESKLPTGETLLDYAGEYGNEYACF